MPRPIPDSNSEAERDRLNVTMHWYAFQMLTIRSRCSLPVSTWSAPSELVPPVAELGEGPLDRAGSSYRAMTGRTRALVERLASRAGRTWRSAGFSA